MLHLHNGAEIEINETNLRGHASEGVLLELPFQRPFPLYDIKIHMKLMNKMIMN